jgi:hypothetical protein
MANKNQTGKRPNKVFALVTYIVALVALLLGMFLPFGNKVGSEGIQAMWACQLPAALAEAFPVPALKELVAGIGVEFTYSLPVTFNGWLPESYDLGALFTVLYALVVLAGIIALIPAIVSTCRKKSTKNTALKAASFIEVIAFIFLAVFLFIQLSRLSLGAEGYQWSWALVTAFGGTFVMLVIQSIVYKKMSGVMKFFLLLLSTLALMITVYDVAAIIPALAEPLDKLYTATSGTFGGGMYSSRVGITPVLWFFCGGTQFGAETLPTLSEKLAELTAIEQTLVISAFILAVLALLNFLLDAMGLGKETKRFMLVSNVVRYTLTLVVAALVIILPIFIEGQSVGLMGVVFAVLTLVALLLNIFRLINAPKKAKKAKSKKEKTVKVEAPVVAVIDDEQPVEEEPIVYVPEKHEQPAALANEEPQVYNPVIYNGPVDDFIKTLPTELKVEFSRVFLERQCGNLGFIPDYKVGGNNDRFFNNVFIYFARLRNAVSDELINKMYEFGNLM